jgi:predicted ester cyclase
MYISAFDIERIVNLILAAYLAGMNKAHRFLTMLRRRPLQLPGAAASALFVFCGWGIGGAEELTTVTRKEEITMERTDTTLARKSDAPALTRDELVARLIKAGEMEVLGGDQTEIDSYFDTSKFRFHGPDGFEADYAGLANYFKSVRAAFEDRAIRRGAIVVEGNYVACQTWIEGRFVREFAQSPAGTMSPNGQRVVWDLINIFRFDDQGLLVEEWVRTDNRSFLRQLESTGQ